MKQKEYIFEFDNCNLDQLKGNEKEIIRLLYIIIVSDVSLVKEIESLEIDNTDFESSCVLIVKSNLVFILYFNFKEAQFKLKIKTNKIFNWIEVLNFLEKTLETKSYFSLIWSGNEDEKRIN